MAQRRGIRAAAIDTGFVVAERLGRVGLSGVTWRARRALARFGFDRYAIDVDGLVLGGSLADHGTFLHLTERAWINPFHREVFEDAVGEGATVLDCGAYIGLYTLLAARRAGSGGTVVAIEPVPPNARALRENVSANGFDDRVEVVEAAAADAPGSAPLHLHSALDQTGFIPTSMEVKEILTVSCVPLDEVMGERRFDVLKVDTEGAEAVALAGLSRTLERSGGAVAFIECHSARLASSGVDPAAWVGGLREYGSLELIDEQSQRIALATDQAIEHAVVQHPMSFNVRLALN
jgi:FkbM family methyltransferase